MPLIQEVPSSPPDASSSEERTQRIRIKNRRKLYLDRHPSYFTSPDLELAGTPNYSHTSLLSSCSKKDQVTNDNQIPYSMTAVFAGFKAPQNARQMANPKAIPGFWKQISTAQKPNSLLYTNISPRTKTVDLSLHHRRKKQVKQKSHSSPISEAQTAKSSQRKRTKSQRAKRREWNGGNLR
jgi:hypothetical protein